MSVEMSLVSITGALLKSRTSKEQEKPPTQHRKKMERNFEKHHKLSLYIIVNEWDDDLTRREGTAKTDVVARKTGSDPWPLPEST